jgi:hypothetical protein
MSRLGLGRPDLPLPVIPCTIGTDRKEDISNVRIY